MTTRRPGAAAFGHLAAAMAHEVRNRLHPIGIHGELMETRLRRMASAPESEAVLRSIGVIAQEVDRIDHILDQYLDTVGPVEGARRATAIGELVRVAIDRAAPDAAQRGVRLVAEVDEAAADARDWVIDGAAIADALDALVQNAIDASPDGAAVTLRIARREGRGVIEVSDAGEGIAEAVLPHVFHLGYTTRPGHAGVGLPVAKQIVKGHGGELVVRSAGPGQGATVRIELPTSVPEDVPDDDDE